MIYKIILVSSKGGKQLHPGRESVCRSILVVEDNADIREAILEALQLEGYAAYGARNGKEGLELLAVCPTPALVLLDLMMPVMSGWKFLETQRQHAQLQKNPVVILSALNAQYSSEDPLPETIDFILKPLDLNRLFETIERFCGPPPKKNISPASAPAP